MSNDHRAIYDLEEVACALLDYEYPPDDEDFDVYTEFYEEFSFDLDDFDILLRRLLPFVNVGSSCLSPNGLSEIVFAKQIQGGKCLEVFIKTGKFLRVEKNQEEDAE